MVPNPTPAIFVPGKIIQVRSQESPQVVCALVLISVEEHIGHVVEMMEWLWPNITETQRAAARLHDIRKKLGAHWEFIKGLRTSADQLRADFYAFKSPGAGLSPPEAGQRYLAFAQSGSHRRFWPTIDPRDFRMDLDPPFGNHAAEVREDDLLPYNDGALDLCNDSQSRNYIVSLIRLHHSFQPDRMISACALYGDRLVTDLYRLIVADHAGSRWAEFVVQQLEGGLERPDWQDVFGDAAVSISVGPKPEAESNGLKVGTIRLRRDRIPADRDEAPEKEFSVHYYPLRVDWDVKHLAEEGRAKNPSRRVRVERRTGKGR